MASLAPDIPLRFMDPRQKYALMNYIVYLGLPARVRREVLSQWGAAMGVEISSSDYDLLNKRLVTSLVPPPPEPL